MPQFQIDLSLLTPAAAQGRFYRRAGRSAMGSRVPFPPSPDEGRSGGGVGDLSPPAPSHGDMGMANGPARWWAASRSTASLGKGWAILNAGFDIVRRGIIVTSE